MRYPLVLAVLLASGITCAALARPYSTVPRISVGPNVRVSTEGRVAHVELTIAADPSDPGLLVGAAIVVDSTARHTATYVTRDRGVTWKTHPMDGRDAVDPQVAFGTAGTLYFVDLGPQLRALRSVDHGDTWGAAVPLGRGYDHPQLGVDVSSGPYHGRVYAAVLGSGWKLGVFQSNDEGAGWTGPSVFADGHGNIGYNVSAALVLHDGTLFVPYFDYAVTPGAQQASQFVYHVWSTTSTDGGASFTEPRSTRAEFMGARLMHGLASFATYAVDRGPRYRDRVYSVWPDESSGVPRVMFQYSDDRGTTWSAQRMIDSSAAREAWQYQPVVAVNRDGVVGVAWFDTRVAGDSTRYDEFFAASSDGGVTFSPATRVSSESSAPRTTGNRAVVDRWLQGGDYAGLVADAGGDFHALWPDSRSGTFQVYTARVTVHPAPP
jgi:BNR repeat-like domain